MQRLAAAVLLSALGFIPLTAQTTVKHSASPGSVLTLIPGEHYKAGKLHRVLLGDKHRDLWMLPLQVEVIDLATYAGGLTPQKLGGGMQTRSLRLRAGDGKTYVFRMLDKDPSVNLSAELRGSIAARLLQDQIAALLPFAGLAVEPLLTAANVLHAKPRVVILPDDARLGEFRPEFGGALGTIEERPDADAGFEGAAEVVSSDKMLESIEQNPRARVDTRDYLTARLLDVLIGDFDRHPDQWRWAGFAEGDNVVWRPIPRDRDFAFTHMDGLLLLLAPYRYPQLVDFKGDYPSLFRLTWSGRALDRRILTELDRAAWDSVATSLQSRLSNERIDAAVARLPASYQPRIAETLRRRLQARRDQLPAAAMEFYELLAGWADVHTTDSRDSVTVTRRADAGLDIEVSTRDRGQARNTFRRTFSAGETQEARVFLHGGDDLLVVQDAPGTQSAQGIRLRVIGGGGDDRLYDRSRVGAATKFYDDRGQNSFERSGNTAVDRRQYRAPPPVSHAAQPRDWGSSWLPGPLVEYSSDYGVVLGASATRLGYGFRKLPYASRLVLSAGYATIGGRFKGEALYERITSNPQLSVQATVRASGIESQRFFGYGNDTRATLSDAAYKLPRNEYLAETEVVLRPAPRLSLSLGPQLKLIDTRTDAGYAFAELEQYGSGRFAEAGLLGSVRFDTRDHPKAATRGILLSAEGSVYPALLDVSETFGSTRVDAATYLTPGSSFPLTLALRGNAQRIWGSAPFHEAAYIGGSDNLRGFRENRFAGDAALNGSAELRLKLANLYLFLPEEFGLHGLADVGRVYVDGASPGGWHSAVGGGFWFSVIDRSLLFSFSVAQSRERTGFYVKGGFSF